MEYECKIVPFDKTVVTAQGIAQPLCNDCITPDCSNPIREQTVAQMGSMTKMRLWVVNNVVRQVVACKGYTGKQNVFTTD